MTHPQPGTTAAVLPLRRRPASTRIGPVKGCPRCHTVLDGGPIQFWCAKCERAVMAADIPTEFGSTLRGAA